MGLPIKSKDNDYWFDIQMKKHEIAKALFSSNYSEKGRQKKLAELVNELAILIDDEREY